jgi:hypothetical protein
MPDLAHDDAPGGEIRAGYAAQQIVQRGVRVLQHAHAGVDDLGEVVGRDVGGHAHGDAVGAVHQQVGESGGQHPGLLTGLVEVGVPVHGVLVDVPEHLLRHAGHAGLGVSVGRGGVAVHGAEVAVAVDKRVAHGKVLGQTHQGVVYGGVAVGMIAAQHVADGGGALAVGLVAGEAVLVHGVEDAPVDGLQTVPHVGQGAPHDDGHGVLDVAGFHFVHKLGIHYRLLGIGYVLRLVVFVFSHLSKAPLLRIDFFAAGHVGIDGGVVLFAISGKGHAQHDEDDEVYREDPSAIGHNGEVVGAVGRGGQQPGLGAAGLRRAGIAGHDRHLAWA